MSFLCFRACGGAAGGDGSSWTHVPGRYGGFIYEDYNTLLCWGLNPYKKGFDHCLKFLTLYHKPDDDPTRKDCFELLEFPDDLSNN